ncbi:MAG: nascent polypeptide-associated complex protein [Candidatus Marsarchaeota archaeon]|jgi:nascent polypeptide-associated complex subunit alpha|nr:nascent polypeptide-associated complex protein [Candidatus Marsarchaeota archaeon]
MMPNMDPRALKSLMSKMGIKSSEVNADSVTIACSDRDILISNPQVTRIEAQGMVSFQISGDIEEKEKSVNVEITDEDIRMVMEKAGIDDRDKAERALKDTNGDIAEAIMRIKEQA